MAEQVIRDHGAIPGFKGHNGFPSTLCVSRNECVVHGIPDDIAFESGDIVSVDCGSILDGFYGDSAYTFAIGDVGSQTMELLATTRLSLYRAIDAAQLGNRLGDIGHAVQHCCEKEHKYSVVRELVGHGIGENLHERPEVPNYGKRGMGPKIKEGLVIAIEPMINLGKRYIVQEKDGWTIRTKDRQPSAHFEHTVAILGTETRQLSNHTALENAVKNNADLKEVSIKN